MVDAFCGGVIEGAVENTSMGCNLLKTKDNSIGGERMSRTLIIVGIATLMVAGSAYASQSRLNSMGAGSIGGAVKNFTIEDERNIFMLPAELVKYMRKTGMEIEGPGFTNFFIHYDLSPTMVLGIYGSNENKSALTLDGVNQSGDFPNNGDAGAGPLGQTHKGTVFFGMALDTTRLGFKLGIWGDNTTTTDDTGGLTSGQGPLVIDFGFGMGFVVGNGDLDLGINVQYGAPTHQDSEGDVTTNSQFDIAVLARGTFPFSGKHEIVPYFGFLYSSASGQVNQDDTPLHTGTQIGVTAGTDIRLKMDNVTVQPGVGIGYQRYSRVVDTGDVTNEDIEANLVVPFYSLAVEIKLFELGNNGYVDLRFGGGQSVSFNSKESYSDAELAGGTNRSDVQHHIATGVGIHYNGVHLDIQVNNGWWQKGPYFVTGDAGGFGMNAALSLDY
jgi:hypothetical protein